MLNEKRTALICAVVGTGAAIGLAVGLYLMSQSKSAARRSDDHNAGEQELRETHQQKGATTAAMGPEGEQFTAPAAEAAESKRSPLEHYDELFRNRILATASIPKDELVKAKPFIGFSLGERVGEVLVSSLYDGTPAHQCGIGLSHQLISIAGKEVSTLDDVRLGLQTCAVGSLVEVCLRGTDGAEYTVDLWIMTKDAAFKGAPYFFDTSSASKIEAVTKRVSSKLERVNSKGSGSSSRKSAKTKTVASPTREAAPSTEGETL